MLAIFLIIAGFSIGLGAVTVIDWHGFLARNSSYWTEATIRTHKVTKPLIWIGTVLAILGGFLYHQPTGWTDLAFIQAVIAVVLVVNGIFLSFSVSPFLLRREKQGKSKKLLPISWQRKIQVSFVVSFIGWWSEVLIFAWLFSQ